MSMFSFLLYKLHFYEFLQKIEKGLFFLASIKDFQTSYIQQPLNKQEPITFEFLLVYANRLKLGLHVDSLHRTNLIQKQYEEYKTQNNLHTHIMQTYLKNCDYKLVLNKFPLNIEKNILHYVLWIKDNVELNIQKYIKDCFKKRRTVVFSNPDHYKSIPSIIHYHVFVEEYLSKL